MSPDFAYDSIDSINSVLEPVFGRGFKENGKGRIMRWSVAIAVALALAAGVGTGSMRTASAQMVTSPSPCEGFVPLRDDAQKKGLAIGVAEKRHADRKELCSLVSRFSLAEGAAVKFLEKNKTWCGVPDEALASAETNHQKTIKFREVVCTAAPEPHAPTLSDALGTPELDTAKNTKTGKGGTFDTLTGNPLAK